MRREVRVESFDVKGLSRDGKVNVVAAGGGRHCSAVGERVLRRGGICGLRLDLCDLLLLSTVLPNQHAPGGTLVMTGE